MYGTWPLIECRVPATNNWCIPGRRARTFLFLSGAWPSGFAYNHGHSECDGCGPSKHMHALGNPNATHLDHRMISRTSFQSLLLSFWLATRQISTGRPSISNGCRKGCVDVMHHPLRAQCGCSTRVCNKTFFGTCSTQNTDMFLWRFRHWIPMFERLGFQSISR